MPPPWNQKPPSKPPRRKPRKNSARRKPQVAAVEDFDLDEDELSYIPLNAPKLRGPKTDIGQIIKDLEHTVEKLASSDNQGAFEKWVQSYDEEDNETLEKMEGIFGTIMNKIRARRSGAETGGPAIRETIESYSKYFVFRDGTKKFILLAPVDVFTCAKSIERKTFGFIRPKGEFWPLKFAISGLDSTSQNPRVLDNVTWSRLSFHYGERHGYHSQASGWEQSHNRGDPQGVDFAAHAERQLIIFYMCHLLKQTKLFSGVETSYEQLLLNTWRLRDFFLQIEIVLSREPCLNCVQFRNMIETQTSLKIAFVIIDTLGKCKLVKDSYNRRFFAMESDETVHEEILELESELRSTRAMNGSPIVASSNSVQVVVPARALTSSSQAKITSTPKIVRKTVTTVAAKRIADYMYMGPPSITNKANDVVIIDSSTDDESDFERDQLLLTSRSQKKSFISAYIPSSARYAPTSFSNDPFSQEARRHASKMKSNQRRREGNAGNALPRKKTKHRKL